MPLLGQKGVEKTKQQSILRRRQQLGMTGNLSAEEVEELLNFELILAPDTVEKQVQYYYLLVKEFHPERASLLQRTTGVLRAQPRTLDIIRELCVELRQHFSEFFIRFEEKKYTISSSSGLFSEL